MAAKELLLVVHFMMGLLNSVTGDLIQMVDVPVFAFAGDRVNVSCRYDLTETGLYSLKWYHNDTEFYRHVPTETLRPVDIKPTMKFQAHEVSRSDTQVTLSISSMTSAATGEYKCEVIAEHPSFRTETRSSFMTVLEEPLLPPVIAGARDVYDSHDDIKLRCQPENFPESGPPPNITWYLEGHPARREFVDKNVEPSGLALRVPASQVSTGGSSVEAECVVKLGTHELRSSTTLRVRPRPSSYLSNYFSAAGMVTLPASCLQLLSLLLLVWLNS